MIRNGKGGGNTKTGLIFEGKTDLETFLSKQKGYNVKAEQETVLFKGENQKIIVVYANFTIVLYANSGNVVTFAPKLYIYDREH